MSLRSQLHDHNHNPKVDDTLTETATNRSSCRALWKVLSTLFRSEGVFPQSDHLLKGKPPATQGWWNGGTRSLRPNHRTAHLIHYAHCPLPSTAVLRWPQSPLCLSYAEGLHSSAFGPCVRCRCGADKTGYGVGVEYRKRCSDWPSAESGIAKACNMLSWR